MAEPIEFATRLEGLDAAAVRSIMRDNTGRLLGLC
jgi:hypothetical protein